MASESTAVADGKAAAALVGRLAEMSHLTSLTTLDALIGAATADDRAAAAQLARVLADRLDRSATTLQNALGIEGHRARTEATTSEMAGVKA
ncbi:MAG TPA: hypothetical protein VFO41_09380 [Alphaproteobacteria bacterium]|nr:hypothetical protein [Alphaproteobacteria bacterium]